MRQDQKRIKKMMKKKLNQRKLFQRKTLIRKINRNLFEKIEEQRAKEEEED
jgi:hypothetical protein